MTIFLWLLMAFGPFLTPIAHAQDLICVEAGDPAFIYSQMCLDGNKYTIQSVFAGSSQSETGEITEAGYAPYIKLDNGTIFLLLNGKPIKVNRSEGWRIVTD